MSSALLAQDAPPPEEAPIESEPPPAPPSDAPPPLDAPAEGDGYQVPEGETPYETAPESEGSDPLKKAEQLSLAQRLAASEAVVKRGATLQSRVSQLLAEARNEADIIMVTCLDDKLAQVNANLRNAQTRLEALRQLPDGDEAKHEYTVIAVVGQKLDTLNQEAAQCAGEDMFATGTTTVTTEINTDEDSGEKDPTTPPTVPPPTVPVVPPPGTGQR